MAIIVRTADLPPVVEPRGPIPGRYVLEGVRHGLEHLSFVFGETAPGQGISLHDHPYEEVFIVHAGTGTYTIGDTTVEAGPGDVVIVPSGMPHRFVNNASVPLHHSAVHSSGHFEFEYRD